jgi:hypothetical protein
MRVTCFSDAGNSDLIAEDGEHLTTRGLRLMGKG